MLFEKGTLVKLAYALEVRKRLSFTDTVITRTRKIATISIFRKPASILMKASIGIVYVLVTI